MKWEEKISRRMGKPLPKAQEAKHQEWLQDRTRKLVLDTNNEVAVVNVSSRSLTNLKRDCILLTIWMSQDAEDLKLHTKNKIYALRCVEADVGQDPEMPANVDCFLGEAQVETQKIELLDESCI